MARALPGSQQHYLTLHYLQQVDGLGVVSAAKGADEEAPDQEHCVQACLGWVQEWNTVAPNCHAAHAVLHAIVSTHSPQVSKTVRERFEMLALPWVSTIHTLHITLHSSRCMLSLSF